MKILDIQMMVLIRWKRLKAKKNQKVLLGWMVDVILSQ